jgi:hypothetical protein
MVTFEDWLAKYQEVYASPDRLSAMVCPNCDTRDLHLVLVVRREGVGHGWAAFWCGHCMTGVALDRAEVRPGMATLVTGGDPQAVARVVPSYQLIPPTPAAVDEE